MLGKAVDSESPHQVEQHPAPRVLAVQYIWGTVFISDSAFNVWFRCGRGDGKYRNLCWSEVPVLLLNVACGLTPIEAFWTTEGWCTVFYSFP